LRPAQAKNLDECTEYSQLFACGTHDGEYMRTPRDIEGTYSAIGASGAVAAGAGGVRLQNANGVVLELAGARVGVELSVALSGVTVSLR
jgi:hypothetical protein